MYYTKKKVFIHKPLPTRKIRNERAVECVDSEHIVSELMI